MYPTKRLAGWELRICEASPPRLWRNDRQLTMVEGAQMLGVLHRFRIEAIEQGALRVTWPVRALCLYVRDLLADKAIGFHPAARPPMT